MGIVDCHIMEEDHKQYIEKYFAESDTDISWNQHQLVDLSCARGWACAAAPLGKDLMRLQQTGLKFVCLKAMA